MNGKSVEQMIVSAPRFTVGLESKVIELVEVTGVQPLRV
jgi:hypothetical protein